MEKSKTQRSLFAIATVFLVLSILALIAVIPGILLDKSPGAMPIQAASGAFIGLIIHLSASTSLATDPNSKTLICSVEEAIKLGGADKVLPLQRVSQGILDML